jgi:acetyltransferase-like isoleucine patch superfamily enzyme
MGFVSDRDREAFNKAVEFRKTSRTRFALRFAKNWFLERLASSFPIPSWRVMFHRWRGVRIGKDVYIGYEVIFDRLYPEMITIDDSAVIADRCIISAHSGGAPLLKDLYPREVKPVRIGRGSWLSPACIVIMGVEIGELSVIGTGAVVTRSIPPKSVAVGVPAKVIRTLDMEIPGDQAPRSGKGA